MPKFNYQKDQCIESGGCHSLQDIYRPILTVGLESDVVVLMELLPCLLDTGADWCLFPIEFLEGLEIERNGLGIDYPQGLGHGHPAYSANVKIHVPEMRISWEASVGFSQSLKEYGVLGHNGFFDRHKVIFDRPNLGFEIIPS